MASAVVARTKLDSLEYLVSTTAPFQWASTQTTAARYGSVREATREAMRLPGKLRAFALPVAGNA